MSTTKQQDAELQEAWEAVQEAHDMARECVIDDLVEISASWGVQLSREDAEAFVDDLAQVMTRVLWEDFWGAPGEEDNE